jgi:serine phosphatase RsbU (regulator of sigma subunit)
VLPEVISATTLRVLLVEDDDGDAFLFEELLSMADLDVSVARERTVASAEARLPGDVACVVLDLGLPDADGLAALHRLRDAAPAVPMLVLTGLSDTARGLEAVAAGAQDYLVKGRVDGELLARSIRYAVERQRAESVQAQLTAANLTAEENSRLERGLLPRPLVTDPRVSVATGYRPGRERALLGGDFYDVVEVADGTLHMLVGDVCGHDPDAAALGVCLRIAWRTLVLGGLPDDALLSTLEEVLVHERVAEEIFATACMVTVAPDRRSAIMRVAGHPLPILTSADGDAGAGAGAARELPGPRRRPPLGIAAGLGWDPVRVELPAGWRLVLYTDGLIEGRTGAGPERLGVRRLVELVNAGLGGSGSAESGRALIDRLIGTAEGLNGGDLTDDVAVLAVTVAP